MPNLWRDLVSRSGHVDSVMKPACLSAQEK